MTKVYVNVLRQIMHKCRFSPYRLCIKVTKFTCTYWDRAKVPIGTKYDVTSVTSSFVLNRASTVLFFPFLESLTTTAIIFTNKSGRYTNQNVGYQKLSSTANHRQESRGLGAGGWGLGVVSIDSMHGIVSFIGVQ